MKPIALFLLMLSVAMLFGCTQPGPEGKEEERKPSEFEPLYLKSLETGKGAKSYVYSYEESYNGQKTKVTLFKEGNVSEVEFVSPLSAKKMFFLANGSSIVCVSMLDNWEKCGYAGSDRATTDYLLSVQAFLFDDAAIKKAASTNKALIEKGAIEFSDKSEKKTISGKQCTEISYVINYTKLSVGDADALGISPNSPSEFLASQCIAPDGAALSKSFSYTFAGEKNKNEFALLLADWNAKGIVPPSNISGSTALEILLAEKEVFDRVGQCDSMKKEERDRCAFSLALELGSLKMCGVAGAKSETCILNFAISRKDMGICNSLSKDFAEDCYLEFAAINKNPSLCARISNSSKNAFCMDVSKALDNSTLAG